MKQIIFKADLMKPASQKGKSPIKYKKKKNLTRVYREFYNLQFPERL
jgi:hypothetical protein